MEEYRLRILKPCQGEWSDLKNNTSKDGENYTMRSFMNYTVHLPSLVSSATRYSLFYPSGLYQLLLG
jgi:hypothetical protein